MKIGTVWDVKVTHLNYVLRGKMVANDSMLSQDANATTLAFTINDKYEIGRRSNHQHRQIQQPVCDSKVDGGTSVRCVV